MTVLERLPAEARLHSQVLKAQQGDRRAFDSIVAEFRPRVRAYCVRLLGSEPEGEQAAQDAFVQAWTHLAGFGARSPFDHWLMRIARNICWNIARTKKGGDAGGGLSLDAPESEARRPARPGFEDEVAVSVYAHQLLAMIRHCAKTARPPWDVLDVMIFHLRFEQCVGTAREIANRLGRSENTVKYRLYKRINPVIAAVRVRLGAEEKYL